MKTEQSSPTDLQITTEPAPDYPSCCEAFLSRSTELDQLATRLVMNAAKAIPPKTPEGQIVIGLLGALARNSTATTAHSLKSRAWQAAQAVPIQTMQDYCEGKIDSLTLAFTDKKIGLLAPIVGPGLVSTLLPKELKTPEAEAYMHRERHYALTAVISHALNSNAPQ